MSLQRSVPFHRLILLGFVGCVLPAVAKSAEIQGYVVDWNCVKPMVRNGIEKTLKQNRHCSMMKKYDRAAYGLITDDKKFYRLDDPGNAKIKQLLKNTPDKDNLKVVVSGDITGGSVKINNISLL